MAAPPRGSRRRVGDDTRARIDELSSGWSAGAVRREPGATGPPPGPERPEREDTMERAPTLAVGSSPDRAVPAAFRARPAREPSVGDLPPAGPEPGFGPEPMRTAPAEATAGESSSAPRAARAAIQLGGADAVSLRPRGPVGDVRYLIAAVTGVAQARRELASTERELARERAEFDSRLVAVANYALRQQSGPDQLDPERAELARLDAEREGMAEAIEAIDAEIEGYERERATGFDGFTARDDALTAELGEVDEELAPLEQRVQRLSKREAELGRAMERVDTAVTAAERALVGPRRPRGGPAAIEAELAALRAEREQVAADLEPVTQELATCRPALDRLIDRRKDVAARREFARAADQEAGSAASQAIVAAEERQRRLRDDLVEIERERDAHLLAVGVRLAEQRPAGIGDRLAGADDRAQRVREHQRHASELRAIVSGVDRGAMVRGGVVLALGVVALLAAVWLALA